MRVWISCTVVGVATGGAAALAYGCGVSAFETCAENGTCVGDGGPDSSMLDGSMGGDASDGGGGGDGSGDAAGDVTGDVHPGEAGCPAPTTLDCSGTCVDPSQPAHCGTCNNVCEGGTPECSGGTCSSGCMAPTPTNCSGSCVNTGTDPQHCGGCTNVCPGPDGGTGSPTCADAGCGYECAQDGGSPLLCGATCVNPTNDPNHCGGCETQCGVVANGSPACVAGSDGGPTCGATCGTGFHGGGTLCDTTCLPNTDDPSTDPCVVANAYGTFVSPSGSDAAGCGTMASPCLTIANAMSVSKTAGTSRVYACGTFITPQVLTAADDGVTVYGGFACSGWAYGAGTPTTVAPGTVGYALTVTGTTTGVTFEHFVFTALGAPQVVASNVAAQSSVAIFANGAALTLTDVAVTAGMGQPGAAGGTPSSNYGTPSTPAIGDLSGSAAAGGSVTCSDKSTSQGGAGGEWSVAGTGLPPGSGLENGTAVSNNYGSNNFGSCMPGTTGDDGANRTTTGAGQTLSGNVTSSGWTVGAAGTPGQAGGPAQGGGGGGADDSTMAGLAGGGGGGGAGGCGGAGGPGGQTGGSSIGILSFQSTLTTTATTITTAGGGTGGAGGSGQGGQGGQTGAQNTQGGCSGGNGGSGGQGAGGGGGAGGLSSGIVWSGNVSQEPSFNGTTYTTQAAPVTGITLGSQGTSLGNGATPPADAIVEN